MRNLLEPGYHGPTVDDVDPKSLYREQTYEVRTIDGWTLVVTRFQPTPQPYLQPIYGEPLLLVHGFGQNRHAWTSGQFNFEPAETLPEGVRTVLKDTTSLLLEGMRRLDDAALESSAS